jgi:hypothetical protein
MYAGFVRNGEVSKREAQAICLRLSRMFRLENVVSGQLQYP